MHQQWFMRTLFMFVSICMSPGLGLAQLHSVEEAQALSQKTGRAIFAMAGNGT
jgi:hypothetical protein